MATKRKQRNFILKTLLVYIQDPKLIAFDGTYCKYLTKDGRKCAVGQHLKKGEWQKCSGTAGDIDDAWGLENVLKAKAKSMNIPTYVWEHIQDYHDNLSEANFKGKQSVNEIVPKIEEDLGIKLPELYVNDK